MYHIKKNRKQYENNEFEKSSECNGIGKCSNGDERTDSGEVVQRNDELAGKRVTVREVCAKTDMGYVKSVRSEMTYSDKGELQSKDIYRWNESSQSWKLSRSYDYAPEGIRFTNYER